MTKRLSIVMGCYDLDLTVDVGVGLDSRFAATCNDTGEKLWINGWLIEDVEEYDPSLTAQDLGYERSEPYLDA